MFNKKLFKPILKDKTATVKSTAGPKTLATSSSTSNVGLNSFANAAKRKNSIGMDPAAGSNTTQRAEQRKVMAQTVMEVHTSKSQFTERFDSRKSSKENISTGSFFNQQKQVKQQIKQAPTLSVPKTKQNPSRPASTLQKKPPVSPKMQQNSTFAKATGRNGTSPTNGMQTQKGTTNFRRVNGTTSQRGTTPIRDKTRSRSRKPLQRKNSNISAIINSEPRVIKKTPKPESSIATPVSANKEENGPPPLQVFPTFTEAGVSAASTMRARLYPFGTQKQKIRAKVPKLQLENLKDIKNDFKNIEDTRGILDGEVALMAFELKSIKQKQKANQKYQNMHTQK